MVPRAVKFIETVEWWLPAAGGWGNGELFNGDRVLVLQGGKSSEDWLHSNAVY